jgi:hypothetical protein
MFFTNDGTKAVQAEYRRTGSFVEAKPAFAFAKIGLFFESCNIVSCFFVFGAKLVQNRHTTVFHFVPFWISSRPILQETDYKARKSPHRKMQAYTLLYISLGSCFVPYGD